MNTYAQKQQQLRQEGQDHRQQSRQNGWDDYLFAVSVARRSMPEHPDDIAWNHILACRKALESALYALGKIEVHMETPFSPEVDDAR